MKESGLLDKGLTLRPRQEIYKISLEHLVPESKKSANTHTHTYTHTHTQNDGGISKG